MNNKNINKFLMALIVVGFLSAAFLCWQRYVIESKNKSYDLVMDYEDIMELSKNNATSMDEALDIFKKEGLTAVALYETSLEKLMNSGKISVYSSSDFKMFNAVGKNALGQSAEILNGNDSATGELYIAITDKDIATDLIADFYRRFGQARVRLLSEGSVPVIALKADWSEELKKQPLGMLRNELQLVEKHGLGLVLRPTNYEKVTKGDIEAFWTRVDSAVSTDNIHGLMPAGKQVPGFASLLKEFADELQKRKLSLIMAESPVQLQFVKQEGQYQLIEYNKYNLVRAYVIPKEEQPKLAYATIVHRWVIGAEERNLNVGLLRKINDPLPGKNLWETNLQYVKDVKNEISAEGFTIGKAEHFPDYFPSRALQIIMCLGVTAAIILFIQQFVSLSSMQAGALYIVLFVILAVSIALKILAVKQGLALLSATLFPVLAITWQIRKLDELKKSLLGAGLVKIYANAFWRLTVMVMLSLVGAFFVGAFLGDVRFWLEIDYYRGVKLTFILPLILTSLVFLSYYNILNNKSRTIESGVDFLAAQVKLLWQHPVKVGLLALGAIFGVIILIFIGRSGHTDGVPVPDIEIKMRYFLENVMYARPREKEFLFGHPAFFVLLFALARKMPNWIIHILTVAAVISLGSLVESFAHLRTPFEMSFMRAWSGLSLGVLTGAAALVVVEIGLRVWHYLQRRFAKNGES